MKNDFVEDKGPDAQDDLNLLILHMLEGIFLLEVADLARL